MLRIEATEPPPWVGPCMTAASSSTTPSSFGSPPEADRVVLGIGLDDRHALDRRIERIVPLLDQLDRPLDGPQPVGAGDGDRAPAPGRLDRRGADGERAQARRGRRGHETTSAHRSPHLGIDSSGQRLADRVPSRRDVHAP